MPQCRYCYQNIVWCETNSGSKIALDPEPSFAGMYVIEEGQDGTKYAKRLPKGSPNAGNRHRVHAQMCPAMVQKKPKVSH